MVFQMSIETGTLFDLPYDRQRPARQELMAGVAVDLAVAAFALNELAILSGKSNEARGLLEAAADPELKKELLERMSEAELRKMIARNEREILPEHDREQPIDPRLMRHLSSLTRPAALINAGFDPAAVNSMQYDTLEAVDGVVGVDVNAPLRAKNMRRIKKLPLHDMKRKSA
jgi:hypothetical protein